jgi:hypothetical protein
MMLFVFLSLHLMVEAQDNQSSGENPMSSFMGCNWGMSANTFSQEFMYKDELRKDDDFYYLSNFELGDLVIKKIKFKFETRDGKQLKLRKKDYDNLYLTEIFIFMKPEQFETLLQIFKVKYGEPKELDEFEVRDSAGKRFLQKVARWEDETIKRLIVMERQASKLVDGMVMFIPKKEKGKVVKKDKIKEAADKI